jgi:hypothetical protein
MKTALSILVSLLSWLFALAFFVFAFTQFPYIIGRDSEGWGSMLYRSASPILILINLILCVLPASLLYFTQHNRIDKLSLYASIATLCMLVLTWLLIEPLRYLIIFGG